MAVMPEEKNYFVLKRQVLDLSKSCFAIVFLLIVLSCQEPADEVSLSVSNPSNFARNNETIVIPSSSFKEILKEYNFNQIFLREKTSGENILMQTLDDDLDGEPDEILFQADFGVNEVKYFTLYGSTDTTVLQPSEHLTTFSRFVPERTDDYAWENDRVAFRTYGPVAQQLIEEGKPGGTLSSGMDAWLKRVDYPIIDKWYRKHLERNGAYHIDEGEGYDPYHVGASRGVGGIGVWQHDSLYVSKNFSAYRTIATGPVRTVFELDYPTWDANGVAIHEKKRISLDLGSNLSRYEVTVKEEVPNLTVGLTMHDKSGVVGIDSAQGWFSYWEPMDGSELGVGVVMEPGYRFTFKNHQVSATDQSHLLFVTEPTNNQIVYYAGFGWKKSKQFHSREAWETYLSHFAKRLQEPLEVNFLKR